MAGKWERHGDIVFEARKAGGPKKRVVKSARPKKVSPATAEAARRAAAPKAVAPDDARATRDPWETMARVERGVEYRALPRLAAAVGLSEEEVAKLASISARTLARRRDAKRFSALESERIVRLEHTVDLARAFFDGDERAARDWLLMESPALRGVPPLQVAAKEVGAREVEKLLGRLAHGIPV